MSLEQITEQMRSRVGTSANLRKSVKFDFGDDGAVRIDDTVSPAVVDNQNVPTDCTVKVSMADFTDMATGKQNPQMAFMMGKLKVEGDMSVAMQLGSILG
ncbi:SCP2 sterol-binding domain-containing protein [Glacieibacterium frigidum]|uniref:SCP2 sterol-binding domain-containing protein n=1 Tax=Glacieibacterium frigidum TaxID=2593303 RepID=A0A552U7Z7_9SPHN|nr:SCP2 sterol-binding domain-containing protein [Glacieibacterium frigidum]TRW14346.1 SCP2 sterol-binding domain-containing protein [Glacieibacterium frigidum]